MIILPQTSVRVRTKGSLGSPSALEHVLECRQYTHNVGLAVGRASAIDPVVGNTAVKGWEGPAIEAGYCRDDVEVGHAVEEGSRRCAKASMGTWMMPREDTSRLTRGMA